MWIWIWVAVICASIIVELMTVQLASIWFAVGGLAALILAAVGAEELVQLVIFILVSLIFLASFRKLALKLLFRGENETTNSESMINQTYVLMSAITKLDTGLVKVNGVEWTATTKDKSEIAVGEDVIVREIKGNKLIVEKKENN